MKKIILSLVTFCICLSALAQEGENIFGIQYRPIIPNKFIGEYDRNYDSLPSFKSTSQQKFGHNFGMIFRHYFKDNVAIESGINFTKRKFALHYEVDSWLFKGTADTTVSFINYQIPVSALVFVRLSDELFMNSSIGVNFDFYPSEVGISKTMDINNHFIQRGYRLEWVQLGANANLGFEYRTRKKGAFYLGATYNLPFNNAMRFNMSWEHSGSKITAGDYVKGSFLTVDFRYYLPVNKD